MNPVEARKLLIKAYQETDSISETARRWHTSRRVVRKWVGRFQVEGETGLKDRSRRPHHSPHRTPPKVEQLVIEARQATNYGRERLALYLERLGVHISPYTIRHILRRHGLTKRRKRRRPLYPALWAWEVEEPFSLIQADVKKMSWISRPLGRKEYNGRVERSHRSDDEEFYRPYLLQMDGEEDSLTLAARWVYACMCKASSGKRDGEANSFGSFAPFGVYWP